MNAPRPVPAPLADELIRATQARTDADDAWHQAIIAAVDAGASLREIARLAGVSHGTIATIAERHHGNRS